MKNRIILAAALIAALAASETGARAQSVEYSLPRTVIKVEASLRTESFVAGPYAKYAKKYLGIDTRLEDETVCTLTEISITPKIEADQQKRYSVKLGNKHCPPFLQLSAQGLIAVQEGSIDESGWSFSPGGPNPIEATVPISNLSETFLPSGSSQTVSGNRNVVVRKTTEAKAEEAAGMIFSIRDQRYRILTGDTDATYSGEAMGAAMEHLTAMEREYLQMFTGASTFSKRKVECTIVPSAESGLEYGLFGTDDSQWTLTLLPEPIARPEGDKTDGKAPKQALHYRIPAICSLQITGPDGSIVLQTRIPVFQFGIESIYPLYN